MGTVVFLYEYEGGPCINAHSCIPMQHPLIQRGPFVRITEIANHLRADMYFTLLFEKEEGPTEIYELVFHPCPVWFKGGSTGLDEAVCIPSHRGPHYVMGDFRCLLDNTGIERNRKVGIVCHDSGHGTEEDLNLLMSEMKSEGFSPQLMFRN